MVTTFARDVGRDIQGITTDGKNLYLADNDENAIHTIALATGAVSKLSLTSTCNGPGTGVYYPTGITTDGTSLYVSSNLKTIRKFALANLDVMTIVGSETAGEVGLSNIRGMVTDGTHLYVADGNNHSIFRIVIATGDITGLAGSAEAQGNADGVGAAATFASPNGITTDGTNLYVSDSFSDIGNDPI